VHRTVHAGFGGRLPGKGPVHATRTRDLAGQPTLPRLARDADIALVR
jgi:hypothetical protein